MAAEGGGWHEEAEKLCGEEDLITALGDRSLFTLDDINLDDIFLDFKDTDISDLGAENPSQSSLFPSANLHGAAAESAPMGAATAAVLPDGLLCDDLDVTQLEWLSNFCDESYSSDGLGFIPCSSSNAAFHSITGSDGNENKKMAPVVPATDAAKEELINFRTSSPISVLEHSSLVVGISPPTSFSTTATSSSTSSLSSPTSSSCSGTGGDSGSKIMMVAPRSPPETVIVPARSRSKRPRPANFSPRPPIIIPLPPPSETSATLSSSTTPPSSQREDNMEPVSYVTQSENAESAGPKKKKKAAQSPATADEEEAAVSSPSEAPVRKCMHCEVTKTPQWRAGPMGPKTLCNACGVRYKSGRLFPQYRPAASPTFVSALHSNSHKRVVEMRNKTIQDVTPATKPGGRRQDVASKACELLEYIRRREWSSDAHRTRIMSSE